ncbi:MAG: hypothetical protein ABMA14_13040 [Hyphomonadaceae bacterium]
MSGLSNTIIAGSVFLTTLAGLGAGYLMSPPPVRSGDSRPIIDPDAWNKTAPVAQGVPAQSTSINVTVNAPAEDANARGWVAPDDVANTSYQDAALYDASNSDTSAGYVVEPLDGAVPGEKGSTIIMVLDKAESDRAWDSAPAATVTEASSASSQASTTH